ncbi:hypothetical protein GWK90_06830 [Candidatus Hamiltonella defensa]|nr:hypothetical protein CCS40_01445 [Candidatus Hamiltonella defensa]MBK4361949.1 hypothetical protein [Candidatus Hamiltonella defensa]
MKKSVFCKNLLNTSIKIFKYNLYILIEVFMHIKIPFFSTNRKYVFETPSQKNNLLNKVKKFFKKIKNSNNNIQLNNFLNSKKIDVRSQGENFLNDLRKIKHINLETVIQCRNKYNDLKKGVHTNKKEEVTGIAMAFVLFENVKFKLDDFLVIAKIRNICEEHGKDHGFSDENSTDDLLKTDFKGLVDQAAFYTLQEELFGKTNLTHANIASIYKNNSDKINRYYDYLSKLQGLSTYNDEEIKSLLNYLKADKKLHA